MRKIVICLTSLFFVYQSSLYAYSSNPKEFVFELVNEAISILSDKSLTKEYKVEFVAKIAKEHCKKLHQG